VIIYELQSRQNLESLRKQKILQNKTTKCQQITELKKSFFQPKSKVVAILLELILFSENSELGISIYLLS